LAEGLARDPLFFEPERLREAAGVFADFRRGFSFLALAGRCLRFGLAVFFDDGRAALRACFLE
jgi:hypothetical protein